MANREIHSTTEKSIAFLYQLITGGLSLTAGLIVDTTGFEALEFLMEGGVITVGEGNAFYQIKMDESDDGSIFAPVDPEFLITDNDTIIASNQNVSMAYIGKKRFVRPSILRFGAPNSATIQCIGITVIGAKPHHIPSAPPVVT